MEWNRTAHPYPTDATVHTLVGRQAARPERVAIVAGDRRSPRRRRTHGGCRPLLGGHRPGNGGQRAGGSLEALSAFWVKAGAAYLPLSVNDPPERMAFMVADAAASPSP